MKIRKLEGKDALEYQSIRLKSLRENPEHFGSSFEEESTQKNDYFKVNRYINLETLAISSSIKFCKSDSLKFSLSVVRHSIMLFNHELGSTSAKLTSSQLLPKSILP
jgi:hypothetical protein